MKNGFWRCGEEIKDKPSEHQESRKLSFGEQPEVTGRCELTVEMHCKVFLQPGWA
jgi:hypothetical protein